MPMELDKALEVSEKLVKKAEKPGVLTTEFWAALATTVIGVAAKLGIFGAESAIAQAISPIMIVAGPVIYILARSGIKKGGLQALSVLLILLEQMQKKEK